MKSSSSVQAAGGSLLERPTGAPLLERPAVGQTVTPVEAMRLAIQEGARGAGFVSPNPLVGCTIVDSQHRFLAVGYHRRVGSDHAEIDAINQIANKNELKHCHVYVTLEPCAHQGRTPSCARSLVPLGPASVTYAVEDPNPLVAGKGAEILRAAGIETHVFHQLSTVRTDVSRQDCEAVTAEAEELAEIFLLNHREKRAFVGVKVAASLDGQMAMVSGESKWITGEAARQHVALVRARYDAVLIGRGTFLQDDPSLNVRHAIYPNYQNRVVVLDPNGKGVSKLAGSKLMAVRPPDHVFVVTDRSVASISHGVQHIRIQVNADGTFSIDDLLAALKEKGLESLLIEGGARTYAEFFKAQRVDRIHVYTAPFIVGGAHGVNWSAHFGAPSLSERVSLRGLRRELLGADEYLTARI